MGGADPFEADGEPDGAAPISTQDRIVDRSHNRDTLSSEAMTEMLRDLQDAMLALDERLVALEASRDTASEDTRRLASGVADMGDALARRVRALEHGQDAPPPILVQPQRLLPKATRPPPQNRVAWSAALFFVLALVLGAFWLLSTETRDRAAIAPAPPRAAAAPPPAPVTQPAPTVRTTTPAKPSYHPYHVASTPHRSTSLGSSPAHTAPDSRPPSTTTGFGHFGPSPAATTPPPTHTPG